MPDPRRPLILIAENDPGIAELLAERLEELGMRAETVATGKEVLSLIEEKDYDLLILDHSLPDMSVDDLIYTAPLPPYIVTTGRGNEATAVKVMKAGAKDYLVKDNLFLFQFPIVVEKTLRDLETYKFLAEAAESREKSERKFKRIFDDSPIGIGLFHPKGTRPDLNEACRRLLGLAPTEVPPADLMEKLLPPSAMSGIFSGESFKEEREIETLDGRKLVEITVSGLRLDSGGESYLVHLEDVTERRAAERKIKDALVEKEHLLKEIHHRVKNNLQIVASLVSLQMPEDAEPALMESFRGIQNRISAMALIHEALYTSSDLSRVNFTDYLKRLAHNLGALYSDSTPVIDFAFSTESVHITLEKAIPLGLLVSELMTNSFRHAFPPDWEGSARIEATIREDSSGKMRLRIGDNGMGMGNGAEGDSLGIKLVKVLAGQLKAEAKCESSQAGTVWTIDLSA